MLGVCRGAPYQTPATQCFPQAWDKWWRLWLLLTSWSNRGRGWCSPWLYSPWPCISAQHWGLAPKPFIKGEQSSDRRLKYVWGTHRALAMLLCWACAGYKLCVARQGFGLQIHKKSHTSLWGQLLITHRLPSPLQRVPPEPLSQVTRVYVRGWASQVLHWKKTRHHTILCVWRKAQWFPFYEAWNAFRILKTPAKPATSLWLNF